MTRPVELTAEHARALLFSARYPLGAPDGSPVAEALAALAAGLEEADKPKQPNPVETFLSAFVDGIERAARELGEKTTSSRPRPRWEWVARAVGAIARTVDSDPSYVSRVDLLGATVRDTFDALGLSLHDEETLYVALVVAGLLVELTSNGYRRGLVDRETLGAIAAVAQSFTAALIPYLPKEARIYG